MDRIKDLACDELQEDLNNLRDLDLGSKEYEVSVDGITKMMDRVIRIEELKAEEKREAENQEFEKQLKQKQMRNERIDRWVGYGLTFLGIAIPTGLTVWGAKKSWKIEQEGYIVSSQAGRKFMDRLFTKK